MVYTDFSKMRLKGEIMSECNFNTAAHDSNPGSRGRESEALPLSHCALFCLLSWSDVHCVFGIISVTLAMVWYSRAPRC